MAIPQINISDYTYDLPDGRIASYPTERRDASKLLLYNKGEISHTVFSSLPDYLPEGALMVFNNTKVGSPHGLQQYQGGARKAHFPERDRGHDRDFLPGTFGS